MKTIRLTSGLRVAGMLYVLMAGAMLQGCGGGGSSTPSPTPTADPTGYYDVTGTASVGDGGTGTLTITDLEAVATKNRIMMMSASNKLLYDITIKSISGSSYTGDVLIYTDNQNAMNATVTGNITSGSKITGTLTGTGAGMGDFTLNYLGQITQTPNTLKTWLLPSIGGSSGAFNISTDGQGNITTALPVINGYFAGCTMTGSINLVAGSSIYDVAVTVTSCSSDTNFNGDYTGLAATEDASSTYLYLVVTKSDGTRSTGGDFFGL